MTPVIETPTESESWEEIGWIGVDSGTVAFGAASVLGEDFRVEPEACPGWVTEWLRRRPCLAGHT